MQPPRIVQMPVVINDDFTISYIGDDVPGAAVVPSVVAGSPEGAPQVLPADVAGSNLNVDTSGGASSLTPDCPAVDGLHVVAPPTAIDPVEPASASSFESWVKLGFDLEVADALTCVGAPLSSLCTTPSPPLTSREVLACDRPWIGAFTARVTQALASVGVVTSVISVHYSAPAAHLTRGARVRSRFHRAGHPGPRVGRCGHLRYSSCPTFTAAGRAPGRGRTFRGWERTHGSRSRLISVPGPDGFIRRDHSEGG